MKEAACSAFFGFAGGATLARMGEAIEKSQVTEPQLFDGLGGWVFGGIAGTIGGALLGAYVARRAL